MTFWGVRGSHPVPGPSTLAFGGNTPCVELRVGGQAFVLDGGSGACGLGRSLRAEGVAQCAVLLTHLHHDHIAGLPFFAPLLDPRAEITIACGNRNGESARHDLDAVFGAPFFPVPFSSLPARVDHFGFTAGQTLRFGNLSVETCPLNHPDGSTAYRFDHCGRSICYITDIEHVGETPDAAVVAFARGADLVIYDAMYTEAQIERCRGWGHSTWQAGAALCKAAGAKRLAAFHHHPLHDDLALAELESELQAAMPGSFYAREGQTIDLLADTRPEQSTVTATPSGGR